MILDIACFEYRPFWRLAGWYLGEIKRLRSAEDCTAFLTHYTKWRELIGTQQDFPFSFFPGTPATHEERYRTGFLSLTPGYD